MLSEQSCRNKKLFGGIALYRVLSDIAGMYKAKKKTQRLKTEKCFYHSLYLNIQEIKQSFSSSCDLTVHEMELSGARAAVISIDNMINKDILSEAVIKPLYEYEFTGTPEQIFDVLFSKVLYLTDISEINSFEKLYKMILSGFAVICIDGCDKMLAVGVQGYSSRSISEPESDIVQRGSRESFVEPMRTNMSMLRRRMKTPQLCFEIMTVGDISNTEICLCYLKNTVSPEILNELRSRIKNTDLDTAFAAGYIVPYLEDKGNVSPFRSVGVTERPDTLCGKMKEGRIGILIDGVPSALVVPCLFAEYFQTMDDYSNRPFFAFFTRMLKFIAFFLSLLLPGFYTALGTFDPEMFPTLTLNKMAISIGNTPLSLTAETIMILLVYEIMRESGLRMPQPLGYAVSIVGGLVIGDTAVNSGFIGAPTLMIVALTVICSYVIPDLYAPVSILRTFFLIVGGIWGVWGIILLFCILLVELCSKESFGIPFTAPIAPFDLFCQRDVVFLADRKTLSHKDITVQEI